MRTLVTILLSLALLSSMSAQSDNNAQKQIPRYVRFSGVLQNKPAGSLTGVTFALYKDQFGGAPLWVETQNVQIDQAGHYTVLLGSTKGEGLPSDLFFTNEAQWLGIQPEGGGDELPRVLLVSVPYALKAGDAETLGGYPVSAFMLAQPALSTAFTAPVPRIGLRSMAMAPAAPGSFSLLNATPTANGTTNFIAKFDANSNLLNSSIFDNGNVGIGTTNPLSRLQVDGVVGEAFRMTATGSNASAIRLLNSSFSGDAYFGVESSTAGGYFTDALANSTVFYSPSNPIQYIIGAQTRLMIKTNGNVGVGTTNPLSRLQVDGVVGEAFRMTATGSNASAIRLLNSTFSGDAYFGVESSTAGGYFTDALANSMVFYSPNNPIQYIIGGQTRLTIQTNGYVGVGTKTPTSPLTVAGAVSASAFSGDGSALTNINAATFGGSAPAAFVTGVNAGTGITGGGAGGTPTVSLDQTFTDNRYAKLSGGNSFVGNQVVTGNLTAAGTGAGAITANSFNTAVSGTAPGKYYIGGQPVIVATTNSTVGNLFMGDQAGLANTTGQKDLFDGAFAGKNNTTGTGNTFVGPVSGEFNTTGNENTFIGYESGSNNDVGSGNTYVGMNAALLNKGDKNVYLGHNTGVGELTESNTMRLGSNQEIGAAYIAGVTGVSVDNTTAQVALVDSLGKFGTSSTAARISGVFGVTTGANNAIPVVIDSNGQLGTVVSSRRFKENIQPMGSETEGLFKLRPVSFYYKSDVDKSQKRLLQYGLIAEEVAKVYPDLVVYDNEGKPYTVKYQYLTPMLLNEVQKQHTVINDQQNVIQAQQEQIQNLEQRLQRLEKLVDRSSATAETRLVSNP